MAAGNGARGSEELSASPPVLDWSEISGPGCYLHIASGLLARVYPGEAGRSRLPVGIAQATRVVKLSSNPDVSVLVLRAIAERHQLPVNF